MHSGRIPLEFTGRSCPPTIGEAGAKGGETKDRRAKSNPESFLHKPHKRLVTPRVLIVHGLIPVPRAEGFATRPRRESQSCRGSLRCRAEGFAGHPRRSMKNERRRNNHRATTPLGNIDAIESNFRLRAAFNGSPKNWQFDLESVSFDQCRDGQFTSVSLRTLPPTTSESQTVFLTVRKKMLGSLYLNTRFTVYPPRWRKPVD